MKKAAFPAALHVDRGRIWHDENLLVNHYGPSAETLRHVRVTLPYPMRLSFLPDVVVTSQFVHELVADSLVSVLEALFEHYGQDGLRLHDLDVLGGIYNPRHKRGGSSWSTHAWGIAIDLAPQQNGVTTPWPETAPMPEEAIAIFERFGWASYARLAGRDAMHFEATAIADENSPNQTTWKKGALKC